MKPTLDQLPRRVHRIATEEDKVPRGFGAMDPALRSELSRRGIAALQQQGKAHHWNSEKAREAALKSWAARRAA